MDYNKALEYCNGFVRNKSSNGLDNMRVFLNKLGNPEKNMKFIHVAVTNGKGSVVSFLGNILMEAGFKTGVYTSPHLVKINERIAVDGENIDNYQFAEVISAIEEAISTDLIDKITLFELLTATAFIYFKKQKCDICVLETGLGGRLDATNVITEPLVSVITKINYDHTELLGDTISSIAKEKAAIIKPSRPAVIAPQQYDNVYDVVSETALNSSITYVDKKEIQIDTTDIYGQTFKYKDMKNIKIIMLGEHQTENASAAIETVKLLIKQGVDIPEKCIYEGLLKTKWICRLELVKRNPITFIDGAHNADGIVALTKFLSYHFKDKKIIFIMGVLKDKDYNVMINSIKPLAKYVYTVKPDSIRAMDAKDLSERIIANNIEAVACDNICHAIECCFNNCDTEDIVCIFGSLYMAGRAREYIKKA